VLLLKKFNFASIFKIPVLKHLLLLTFALASFGWANAQMATDSTETSASNLELVAIDTFNTDDKFVKIVIYGNHTWEYFDIGRPVIDDTQFDTLNWYEGKIHAYKEVPLEEIPDEVDLMLVDSIHPYHAPAVGRITSRYCWRRTRNHNGTDIKVEVGDPIYAAFDGRVRISEYSAKTGGYGNLIIIRHANGLETYYGHLSGRNVAAGEVVKAGEVIGYGGNTGRSTGSHLHFEARYQGQSFDPERLFDFTTGQLRDSLITLKKHHYSIYSHYGMTDDESAAASQRIRHKVKSGDTLSGLAKKYQTTVSNICKLNGIKSTTMLRVGQYLIVR